MTVLATVGTHETTCAKGSTPIAGVEPISAPPEAKDGRVPPPPYKPAKPGWSPVGLAAVTMALAGGCCRAAPMPD